MTKLSTERQIKAKPKKKKKLTTITEEKNPGGRPPIYTNPEEMESKAEEYFSKCDTGEEIEVLAKNGTVVKNKKNTLHCTRIIPSFRVCHKKRGV